MVEAKTKFFAKVTSAENANDLLDNLPEDITNVFILGQGANILFTKDFPGLIVKNEILGKKVVSEDDDGVVLEVAAGESWIDLVVWAAENGWSGIENLAYIPGTVGAAPVQNLAAYGQNFGESVVSVTGINISDRQLQTLTAKECQLYYRDSIFKHDLKDKFFITKVTVKLSRFPKGDVSYYNAHTEVNNTRISLLETLKKIGPPPYGPKEIVKAVTSIRQTKLPDWHKLGTAGSFFANPFVSKGKFEQLSREITNLQAYPINAMLYPNPDDPVFKKVDQVKIPAARLLDELGWRGKRIRNVGTFEKHALVVVNYGGATGQEILDFTRQMQADIKSHFDIDLEPEVNIT